MSSSSLTGAKRFCRKSTGCQAITNSFWKDDGKQKEKDQKIIFWWHWSRPGVCGHCVASHYSKCSLPSTTSLVDCPPASTTSFVARRPAYIHIQSKEYFFSVHAPFQPQGPLLRQERIPPVFLFERHFKRSMSAVSCRDNYDTPWN